MSTEQIEADGPPWPGRRLEVIELTRDVAFHVPDAGAQESITIRKSDVVNLGDWL